MIGLDTNVIVRYVIQDDPTQSAAAAKLIDSLSAEAPAFFSLISVVELAWVLQSCYSAKRAEIADVIETLLRSKQLIVERAEIVSQSLRRFAAGNADFADCLIERCGHAAECQFTFTFDQNASTTAGMRLLK